MFDESYDDTFGENRGRAVLNQSFDDNYYVNYEKYDQSCDQNYDNHYYILSVYIYYLVCHSKVQDYMG